MGAILAIPFTLLFKWITKPKANSDDFPLWKNLFAYLWIRYQQWVNKPRLDIYDLNDITDGYKNGILAPDIEWNIEKPQDKSHFTEGNWDGAFFYGINTKNESLVLQLTRIDSDHSRLWLRLNVSDDECFVLPQKTVKSFISEDFNGGGLKIKCLIPFRKYRIFYNGLLKRESKDEEETWIHVRFAFIWTPLSHIFDLQHDVSCEDLTKAFCREQWEKPIPNYGILQSHMNIIEQHGSMMGTVSVSGETEKEYYFLGSRRHFLGLVDRKEIRMQHFYCYLHNGSLLIVGKVTIPGLIKNLTYGHILLPSTHLVPLENIQIDSDEKVLYIKYKRDEENFVLTMNTVEELCFSEKSSQYLKLQRANTKINNQIGLGLIITETFSRLEDIETTKPKMLELNVNSLVVPFSSPLCLNSNLTGGKGSSLAHLYKMTTLSSMFEVPNGLVITTQAYNRYISHNKFGKDILNFEEKLRSSDTVILVEQECNKLKSKIEGGIVPDDVYKEIEKTLFDLFPKEGINKRRFAVRSSATGEDSEEMSAAGQMNTYLGVQGLKEILKSLKKCWGSQFSFIAFNYKRQNGQTINQPMGVVIQEMVEADVAGVIFSCDPVSSNPEYIIINANYGLGESVVSAKADPDTIILKRSYSNSLNIIKVNIGSKKLQITTDENGGVIENEPEEEKSKKCCLEEKISLKLGRACLEVEEYFFSPRDIEFAIIKDTIYLLQSRPVTSIDQETDFEIMHEQDSAMKCENDIASTANIGEVIPGAMTPLGLSTMLSYFAACFQSKEIQRGEVNNRFDKTPYVPKAMTISYNHLMFNVADFLFRFGDSSASLFNQAIQISFFGRTIDDPEIIELATSRSIKTSTLAKIKPAFHMIKTACFTGDKPLEKADAFYQQLQLPYKSFSDAKELNSQIHKFYADGLLALKTHLTCTNGSSFFNLITLIILAKSQGGFTPDVFIDFANLLAVCSNVESADVPDAIEELAQTISKDIDAQTFKSMTSKEAYQWLNSEPTNSNKKFREFLKKHGHRGYKEFDIGFKTWGTDPESLVKTIQGVVGLASKNITKSAPNVSEAINGLKTPIGWKSKLLLRFILPFCWNAVRRREKSKSLLIGFMNKLRLAYSHLAFLMEKEGRVADKELVYFMTTIEIFQLLDNRYPRIIAKAIRRRKAFPYMDKILFPEIIKGIPKPTNLDTEEFSSSSDKVVTGITVRQGIVKAPARVIRYIEDAHLIQNGDILIAYSTDIGWTPFFPLLSGVVTELGGLVSHGAVVAREYGLPCIISATNATSIFKSGEIVVLDANKGTISAYNE